jgi:hypothetical protein
LWTAEEDAIVKLDLPLEQLARRLPGRPLIGIKRRQWFLSLPPEQRLAAKLARRGEHRKPGPDPQPFYVASVIVPDDVFEERERRYQAALQRTVTAALLGDPPPGYSALDRTLT